MKVLLCSLTILEALSRWNSIRGLKEAKEGIAHAEITLGEISTICGVKMFKMKMFS